jgi:uncharacterized FlgJ-related protein
MRSDWFSNPDKHCLKETPRFWFEKQRKYVFLERVRENVSSQETGIRQERTLTE